MGDNLKKKKQPDVTEQGNWEKKRRRYFYTVERLRKSKSEPARSLHTRIGGKLDSFGNGWKEKKVSARYRHLARLVAPLARQAIMMRAYYRLPKGERTRRRYVEVFG